MESPSAPRRNGDDEDGLPREYLSLRRPSLFCSSGTGVYGCLDAGMTGTRRCLSKSIFWTFSRRWSCLQFGRGDSRRAVFLRCFFAAKAIYAHDADDDDFCGGFLLIDGARDFPVPLVMPLSALWTNYIAPLL